MRLTHETIVFEEISGSTIDSDSFLQIVEASSQIFQGQNYQSQPVCTFQRGDTVPRYTVYRDTVARATVYRDPAPR